MIQPISPSPPQHIVHRCSHEASISFRYLGAIVYRRSAEPIVRRHLDLIEFVPVLPPPGLSKTSIALLDNLLGGVLATTERVLVSCVSHRQTPVVREPRLRNLKD